MYEDPREKLHETKRAALGAKQKAAIVKAANAAAKVLGETAEQSEQGRAGGPPEHGSRISLATPAATTAAAETKSRASLQMSNSI